MDEILAEHDFFVDGPIAGQSLKWFLSFEAGLLVNGGDSAARAWLNTPEAYIPDPEAF